MGYTEQTFATSADSISTYDSNSLSPGTYDAAATLGCNDVMLCTLVAVKGAGALAQPAQSISQPLGSYSGISLAFANPNTAGNCIIVSLDFGSSFPVVTPTISDSQGNTYTQIQFGHPGGSGVFGGTWIAFGIAAGANTVTVSLTGAGVPGTSIAIAISEYTGGTAVDAYEASFLVGAGTNNLSVTTTATGDLLYLGIGVSHACAGSPSNVTGGNPLTPPVPPQAWLIVNEPGLSFTDRSSFLYMDGSKHSFDLKLRERGTANYTLVSDPQDPTSAPLSYAPTMGQPIYLYDQNISGYTLVFAGLIQDYTVRWVGIGGLRFIDVTAVSLESVFDTVYAEPMQFVNQTCGAILTALFNAFENGCPVSLGNIQAGPQIALFNAKLGDKLSDLFSQLATTAEFTWGVNPATQQLFFQLPTATPAPFTIDSSKVLWDSISQKYDNADYRNRQAVQLSFDAFPHSEEYFVGSGQTQFTLMRPLEQGVNAYVTTATPNTATASFSGQPSPGDTIGIGPAAGAWQGPSHIYALGGYIIVSGFVFQVTTAGTSGLTEPNFLAFTVTGDTVSDNSVIWTCRGTATLGSVITTYEFVTALDNTQYGQILIGATLAQTVQNTVDAMNAAAPYGGTPATNGKGLTVSLPTWENSQVNAISVTGTGFTVTQKIPGSGNVAALSRTGSAFAWSAANTSGGTSPQTPVGPNEPAWLSIAIYAAGTSTSAPGLIYTPGSAVVNLATPLNSGTNLVVEYTRTDGNVIEVENTPLVAALAAISHGTGKYQQSTDQSSTGLIDTSAAAGLQFAQQILATFDITQQKFSLEFYRPGILPGQVLTLALNSPLNVMNGSYLVLGIKGELVPCFPWLDNPNAPNAGHYRFSADLINVNLIGTDLAFWLGLGGGGAGGSGTAGALVATSGSTGQTGGLGPGGTSPEVQYNTGAAFGGITGATSDGTNLLVTTQPPGTNNTTAASTAFVQAAVGSGGLPASAQTSWDETPAGTINGSNVTFTLANAPSPAASLQLFQNGVLAIQGVDYTLSGSTITMGSAPSTGAILNAFYRYGSPPGVLVDDETPGGTVNGSNVTFTLAHAPSPATSLKLFDNGVLQIQGADYTLSGLTITFTNAPTTGDELVAYYAYSVSATNYADNETPSGTVNGSNATFGLAHTPNPAASLNLYVNGVLQLFGTDFTLATATITMTSAPSAGAILTAFYRY
jgi:hypothetical protein